MEDTGETLINTQLNLAKLLAETEEKSRLEMERIQLERERAKKQEEILESENRRNTLLSEVTVLVEKTNSLIMNDVVPVISMLRNKTEDIWRIQEVLVMFLLREYEKLNDERYESVIDMLKQSLNNISSMKSDIHVVGSMQANQDVNMTTK